MLLNSGHLTYCTNIHAGETWPDHFTALKRCFPSIKDKVSPDKAMGIGLRLSNVASEELVVSENLNAFKQWLKNENAYVFTMNGFPYEGFHHTQVKDQVHAPDWTTNERVDYTIRLFNILKELVPENMDGGISTSPLSYRHWYANPSETEIATVKGTENILRVVKELILIEQTTTKLLHLDIEPEPDGLLETGNEFIKWYQDYLLPIGVSYLQSSFDIDQHEAESLIKRHLKLCYDVCHFAIGYEDHDVVCKDLAENGIGIGKIQISAALKALLNAENKAEVKQAFSKYNEPTYLHQVVARKADGTLERFADLSNALENKEEMQAEEWRAHFHVPIFLEDFGLLQSTNDEIRKVLKLNTKNSLSNHLEVETYTWEVLPQNLKQPIEESISRELLWVKDQLR